ncbi:MAG: NUDIX domain-containing protein [Rhizonema sp. NSF051]|nr:NUDIX domain-containing protein [Rhizonema sp. NSF051]
MMTWAFYEFGQTLQHLCNRYGSRLVRVTDSNAEVSYVVDLFDKEKGYATPKIDVRAAVFRDDKLLLVKEKEDGCWTLPGGWADIGDSPSEAVVREVYEESGYQTKAVKLLAVYDRSDPRHRHPPFQYYVYKLFFQCELIGGTATESFETEGAEFFGEHEIPQLSLTRVVPIQITRVFEHYRHPNYPTDFD